MYTSTKIEISNRIWHNSGLSANDRKLENESLDATRSNWSAGPGISDIGLTSKAKPPVSDEAERSLFTHLQPWIDTFTVKVMLTT